jgi:hypothetical protein
MASIGVVDHEWAARMNDRVPDIFEWEFPQILVAALQAKVEI